MCSLWLFWRHSVDTMASFGLRGSFLGTIEGQLCALPLAGAEPGKMC